MCRFDLTVRLPRAVTGEGAGDDRAATGNVGLK
jgi:hypothetical protein